MARAHAASLCVHLALVGLGALIARGASRHAPTALSAGVAPRTDAAPIELDLVARRVPTSAAPVAASASSASAGAGRRRGPASRVASAPAVSAHVPVPVATTSGGAPTVTEDPLPRVPGAMELLRATRDEVMRAGAADLARSAAGVAEGDAARIRRELGAYLHAATARERHDNVAGSSVYYRPLRQAMERSWRPQAARTVSVAEGIAGSVFTGPEGFRRVSEAMEGTMAPTRRSAVANAADHAHPNSPMLTNPAHPTARAEATARTTRAVLEVDQDRSSRIVALRVVESSGFARFDASARDAITAAIDAQEPHAMPGGWRSRWLFEVTHTRTPPPVGFLPSLPDEAPRMGIAMGGTFDESTGEVRAAVPFALNERRAVRLLWSEALGPAREVTDGGA